ncbi:DUF6248 family natural product biosynthesis protein [Streptomyces sp. NBC_01205]|uniref:DUF6248 family natural product biosynthesis protein n=1 Tax=Streptomyces sp. NBC_01205 TaxID=2903771 RepID=UPI002E1015C4|nr:DUF6248 family natural product biosynthesis protein [Streptomyces sp. NBC_01205]
MTENQATSTAGAPEPQPAEAQPRKLLRIAQAAAALAVAAADEATEAVCRSRSGNTARLEEVMHAAHAQARDAEKYADWAAEWDASATTEHTLVRYATSAVDHAVRAQSAAGIDTTAAALRAELEQPPTPQQHAERESERRRREAQAEAEERAATGMDQGNRDQAYMNAFYAEDAVPQLGWTAGHVRVLEVADTGRLYWRDRQARQAARHGEGEGGRKVSADRTRALYEARFLVATRQDGGARVLTLSPMGRVALELARLYPEGLHATDKDAYQARYDQVAKRYDRSDEKKAAARRLPPLEHSALRNYRRPVTLVEQELQAQRDEAEQWEDEGGYCPGVQAPRPAAAASAESVPTAVYPSVRTAPTAPAGQELLRRLFAPRVGAAPSPDPLRTVIRRPRRTLTPQEREVVQDVPLLNFQGALIMGLVDPVPNASPMPETEGEWVREHAWPDHFHTIESKYPWGFYRWAMCERGVCWNCLSNRCDLCVHRQEGGPHVDDNTDWVHGSTGRVVARLILRADDAPCVWWCRCACPKDGPAPGRNPAPAATPERIPEESTPASTPRRPVECPEQDALF